MSVSADVVVADTEAAARELATGYGLWVRSIRTAEGAIQFPTPEQARRYVWSDPDRELVADRIDTQFVGTPGQVADQLERLRDATEADELIITTITHDHADRVLSYQLLAEEWADGDPRYRPTRCGSGSHLDDSCDDCIEIAIWLVRVVSNSETRRANSIGQVGMTERNKFDDMPTITSSALSVFEEEHDLRGTWRFEIIRNRPDVKGAAAQSVSLNHLPGRNDPWPGFIQQLPVPGVYDQRTGRGKHLLHALKSCDPIGSGFRVHERIAKT